MYGGVLGRLWRGVCGFFDVLHTQSVGLGLCKTPISSTLSRIHFHTFKPNSTTFHTQVFPQTPPPLVLLQTIHIPTSSSLPPPSPPFRPTKTPLTRCSTAPFTTPKAHPTLPSHQPFKVRKPYLKQNQTPIFCTPTTPPFPTQEASTTSINFEEHRDPEIYIY